MLASILNLRLLIIGSLTTFIATPLLARQEPALFHRAINLNGPALIIDGHPWESGSADGLESTSKSFENQNVPLKPSTDPSRAEMIRSTKQIDAVFI
jgi:hypothetical protein